MSIIKTIKKELAENGLTDINNGLVKKENATPYDCTKYPNERYKAAKDGVDSSSLTSVKEAISKIQEQVPATQFSARSGKGKGGDDKLKGGNTGLSR